jgi:hypothetical protein
MKDPNGRRRGPCTRQSLPIGQVGDFSTAVPGKLREVASVAEFGVMHRGFSKPEGSRYSRLRRSVRWTLRMDLPNGSSATRPLSSKSYFIEGTAPIL